MSITLSPYRIVYFKDRIDKIIKGEIPPPVMVEFFLTGFCNHSCIGCLFKEYHSKEYIPLEDILSALKDIKGRVISLEFCGGGEPTLHPDFVKIISEAHKFGFKIGLISNGSMLWKYYNDIVKYLSYIRISLDAPNSDIHRKVHRSKDFDSIVKGIRLLIEEKKNNNGNIEIGLKFLVSENNRAYLEEFVEFAKSLNVDSVQIKALRKENGNSLQDKDVLEKWIKELKDKYPGFVMGGIEKSVLETELCLANLLSCFVIPDGSMMICCYYQNREEDHCIGNIRDGFWNVWESQKHIEKILNIDKQLCNIYDCRYHKYNQIIYDLKENGVNFV